MLREGTRHDKSSLGWAPRGAGVNPVHLLRAHRHPVLEDGDLRRFVNDDYGALFVEATHSSMSFQFITRTGKVVDTYRSQKSCEGAPPVPIRTAQ